MARLMKPITDYPEYWELQKTNTRLVTENLALQEKLRDQFAMAALEGWLSTFQEDTPTNLETLSKYAYEIADAMLAARRGA